MYDVSEPKMLRRVHQTLKEWGQPLQYSVFRVRGTLRELEQLHFRLTRILEATDRLLVVRLCPACAGRVVAEGRNPAVGLPEEPEPFKAV
jgi:CRISPR-associated protein Cas2